jgi:hypothetical protein
MSIRGFKHITGRVYTLRQFNKVVRPLCFAFLLNVKSFKSPLSGLFGKEHGRIADIYLEQLHGCIGILAALL